VITRFAPSPTGPLHLGHAYSACIAADMARAASGTFLLRIEDIDQTRARAHWEDQIYDDLHWLGLTWPLPVLRQSDRLAVYHAALDRLWARDVLYPCHCTRRDIAAAASAPQEGTPLLGPDGVIYPGTCRRLSAPSRAKTPRPRGVTLRLDMRRALDVVRAEEVPLSFIETGQGPEGQSGRVSYDPGFLIHQIGDVVLSRRDFPGSYHLAVTCDDEDQHITDVVRGQDLFDATPIHVLLQRLLEFATPRYHHHRLIRDDQGKRLAKRDDARALSTYRAAGVTPEELRSYFTAAPHRVRLDPSL